MMPFSKMHLPTAVANAYATSLHLHLEYVYEAGLKVGVPVDILFRHDSSKWDEEEFVAYANHFHGNDDPQAFARAWLGHVHKNAHHWQHWIVPEASRPFELGGVIEMPEDYIREMLADWMGANRAYRGNWGMTDWLIENTPGIRLHPKSAGLLTQLLLDQGYSQDILKFRTD